MTTEIAGKDSVKLNLLSEALGGSVTLSFRLGSGTSADYAKQIHKEGGQVYKFGSFTVSEEAADNVIKIRPTAAGEALTVYISSETSFAGKSAGVFRSATKSISEQFPVTDTSAKLELTPTGTGYSVTLINAGDADRAELQTTEQTIAQVQQKSSVLAIQKQQTAEKLRQLEAEYNKDFDAFQSQLDDFRERVGADSAVLEYYKDRDIKPTEDLLKEISAKLDEAEAQIKLFIEAKQRKTIEIETEIRSNKV